MRLSELKTGESATILKVCGHGGFRRRIMEMGFVRGQRVEVVLNAPLRDPIEYKVMGYDISLRRSEAEMVVVLSDAEALEYMAEHHHRHHHHHEHGERYDRPDHGRIRELAERIAADEGVVTASGAAGFNADEGSPASDSARGTVNNYPAADAAEEQAAPAGAPVADTAGKGVFPPAADAAQSPVAAATKEAPLSSVSGADAAKKGTFSPSAPVAAPAEGPEAPCATLDEVVSRHSRRIEVALVGNPNSGKTSLFNAISGSHEHVGNYSGVTVDAKRGYYDYRGYRFEITDLPGTYALSAYTPEELYVRRHIERETPDVIVNAVVASNLERNLYLTTELIDMNPRMVVALNMYDELESSGSRIDYDALGGMLGVPMVPVVARSRRGIETLLDTVIAVYENRDPRVRHIHINQGPVIEQSLRLLNSDMNACRDELPKSFPPRYLAMKLLEGDREVTALLKQCSRYPQWAAIRDREVRRIEQALGEDVETAFANQKYGFISGALKETYTPGVAAEVSATALIDAFVTHKLWGFPVFFFLMWLMFWCTFRVGAYPQEWIDALVGRIGSGVDALMPDGTLKDLLVNGVIGGVGSVIVFLPNIMILYLFISFMEDSGYLARAAFIMDRVMHRIGLHGKSFIPLVMGFGCNVPAIMASRTIESRSSRLITIMITPFMSCSARLPVYILIAGTFFAAQAGAVLFGLYVGGILLAVVTARLMRRVLFPVDETPFVMELPPYRLPTWRTTLRHMWDKCAHYLRKMGGMILIASVVIWFLSYYPRTEQAASGPAHYENSYLGRVGKACEPVFAPLGLNWKAGVALLSGVAAKEIVVSTIGVLYAGSDPAAGLPTGDAEVSPLTGQVRIIGGADGPTAVSIAEAPAAGHAQELASGNHRAEIAEPRTSVAPAGGQSAQRTAAEGRRAGIVESSGSGSAATARNLAAGNTAAGIAGPRNGTADVGGEVAPDRMSGNQRAGIADGNTTQKADKQRYEITEPDRSFVPGTVASDDGAAETNSLAEGGARADVFAIAHNDVTDSQRATAAKLNRSFVPGTIAPDDGAAETNSLAARLRASGDFSTAAALAFLVFMLVYFPCIATVAAVASEAGWKWATASILYNTALAWVLAWATYRIALLF